MKKHAHKNDSRSPKNSQIIKLKVSFIGKTLKYQFVPCKDNA
jgi:hypothetical protein